MYLDEKKLGEVEVKPLTQTQQVLQCALDIVSKPDGWVNRAPYGKHRDKHCVITAIYAASNNLGQRRLANPALICLAHAINSHQISAWNDAPWRTLIEVQHALQRAIALGTYSP